MARFDLTDFEWELIQPLLPNKPRGVARVDDRRVLNGLFWVLRTGSPWRDLPERYGPHTTIYNRFNRWAKAGVWVQVFETLSEKSPDSMQFIVSLRRRPSDGISASVLSPTLWPTISSDPRSKSYLPRMCRVGDTGAIRIRSGSWRRALSGIVRWRQRHVGMVCRAPC